MPVTLWLNVDDLLQYARMEFRPSGIQRLSYEICAAMVAYANADLAVCFVAHAAEGAHFEIVPWADVAAAFSVLTVAAPTPHAVVARSGAPAYAPSSRTRKFARGAVYRLPVEIREPLLAAYFDQRQSAREIGLAIGAARRHLVRMRRRRAAGTASPRVPRRALAEAQQPGDVLVTLGAHWGEARYPEMVATVRAQGLRHALMVHDLIPVLSPEWCDPPHAKRFASYIVSMLPLADVVLTISRSNAADIARFAGRMRIERPGATVVLPIGNGFQQSAPAGEVPRREVAVPVKGPYVLCVSTIEARKNHTLLLLVWRQLLDELGAERLPRLVLVGKVGWLVDDLMAQLHNCRFLDGHIVLIEQSDDQELAALYRDCLFTVYPSFYEGWGLPVTESLGFGRACIASGSSSLPEAGGTFARYFPSGNATAAAAMIRDAILDPDETAQWNARIARDYQPKLWQETAQALAAAARALHDPA